MSRPNRNWRHLAEIAPDLPLARGISRRLAVRAAWTRVAGERLASRLPALERKGDCLILAVPTQGWLRSIPALEARLARKFAGEPALRGVRRLDGRMVESTGESSLPVPRPQPRDNTGSATGDARARLAALAERLLARDRES